MMCECEKPTPGPWELTENGLQVIHRTGVSKCDPIGYVSIIRSTGLGAARGRKRANARLIATAPELLDALEFYISAWDGGEVEWFKKAYEAYDRAAAAVKKA